MPGKCEIYAGLRSGINVWHAGNKSELTQFACSLDAPGHFGKTTDAPHPLMGVAHMNFRVAKYPDDLSGATGLLMDGDRPDAKPKDYEVAG